MRVKADLLKEDALGAGGREAVGLLNRFIQAAANVLNGEARFSENVTCVVKRDLIVTTPANNPTFGGGSGGVTDHGALTGLADDDHPQYALADGTRGAFVKRAGDTMTGALTVQGALRTDGTFSVRDDSANGLLARAYPQTGVNKNRVMDLYTDADQANSPAVKFGIVGTTGWITSDINGVLIASTRTGTGTTKNLYLAAANGTGGTLAYADTSITLEANTGRVGIGTGSAALAEKLHVLGNGRFFAPASTSGYIDIAANNGAAGSAALRLWVFDAADNSLTPGWAGWATIRSGGSTNGLGLLSGKVGASIAFSTVSLAGTAATRMSLSSEGALRVGDSTAATEKLEVAGNAKVFGKVMVDPGSTATPGAVTINKGAGQVVMASGASTIVVTNSLVTATSLVFAVPVGTGTAKAVALSVTPAAGSFTIQAPAALAAALTINFLVVN